MLKIKDNVDLIKIVEDYDLDSEIYEGDIETWMEEDKDE